MLYLVLTVFRVLGSGFQSRRQKRRKVPHFNITDLASASWSAQQLSEAFPFRTAPRYLLGDRGTAFMAWNLCAAPSP
jgi:hypothetical protein